jgi:hypothetical protein
MLTLTLPRPCRSPRARRLTGRDLMSRRRVSPRLADPRLMSRRSTDRRRVSPRLASCRPVSVREGGA